MHFGQTAVISACCALLAGAANAGTVSVTGPAQATPGGTVTVAVTLSPDLGNAYALQGGLSYDPAVLTPLPSQDATAPQGYYTGSLPPFPGETIPKDADLFRMNTAPAGVVIFGYVKNPSNPAGSSSLTVPSQALHVSFNVASGAQGTTSLQLSPYTVNGQSLPAILVGGIDGSPLDASVGTPLTINLGTVKKPGDANKDSVVDLNDVLLVLQVAGGVSPPGAAGWDAANADVWPSGSPDSAVTAEDGLRIWRFLNGLDTNLN